MDLDLPESLAALLSFDQYLGWATVDLVEVGWPNSDFVGGQKAD